MTNTQSEFGQVREKPLTSLQHECSLPFISRTDVRPPNSGEALREPDSRGGGVEKPSHATAIGPLGNYPQGGAERINDAAAKPAGLRWLR